MTELGFVVGGGGDGYDGWTTGWTDDGRVDRWTDEWTVGKDGRYGQEGVVGQQGQVGQVGQVGAGDGSEEGGQDGLPEHEGCPREVF